MFKRPSLHESLSPEVALEAKSALLNMLCFQMSTTLSIYKKPTAPIFIGASVAGLDGGSKVYWNHAG